MSSVAKGIGKVFKAAAPVAIGFATGGPVGAAKGLASTALNSALGGGGLFGGGQDAQLAGAAQRSITPATPLMIPPSSIAGAGESGSTTSGFADFVEKNPETVQMIAGTLGGAAKGFAEGRRHDELLEERRRQFDAGRQFAGSFYGREASRPLLQHRRA